MAASNSYLPSSSRPRRMEGSPVAAGMATALRSSSAAPSLSPAAAFCSASRINWSGEDAAGGGGRFFLSFFFFSLGAPRTGQGQDRTGHHALLGTPPPGFGKGA